MVNLNNHPGAGIVACVCVCVLFPDSRKKSLFRVIVRVIIRSDVFRVS